MISLVIKETSLVIGMISLVIKEVSLVIGMISLVIKETPLVIREIINLYTVSIDLSIASTRK